MGELTPEAKAEMAEAVRIVANSRVLKHIRNSANTPPIPSNDPIPTPVPTGGPVPTPPPAKPPVVEPPKVEKRGLYWGDRNNSE